MTTNLPEVHEGDVGTIFRVTVRDTKKDGTTKVLDVSAATTLQLIFKKPNSTVVTQTATLTSDGTDGRIQYTTVSDDLTPIGTWEIQARVVFVAGDWRTQVKKFKVNRNL